MKGEQLMTMLGNGVIIEARGGYRLSKREMDANGIRRVYNASGAIEHMGIDVIQEMVNRAVRGIECVLVESAFRQRDGWKSPVKVVSLLVFKDEWSVGLYVLRNKEQFGEYRVLQMMN